MRALRFFALLLALVLLAACRQQQPTADNIQLALTVTDMNVGETTLLVEVSDSAGKRLPDPGTLTVRGNMDHAGMAPVLAESRTANDGVFALPFEWTMAGGWSVEAALTLADGTVAAQVFRYEILAEAGAHADHKMDMDHGAMNMADETSAAYMRISNRGESDITLASAMSAAAKDIRFHETLVENDMARMQALDSLLIPAGATLELRPGKKHIMLQGLKADLKPDTSFQLQLVDSGGATYDLEVAVMNMLMPAAEASQQIGDLVFSDVWARPAQAGMSATPAN